MVEIKKDIALALFTHILSLCSYLNVLYAALAISCSEVDQLTYRKTKLIPSHAIFRKLTKYNIQIDTNREYLADYIHENEALLFSLTGFYKHEFNKLVNKNRGVLHQPMNQNGWRIPRCQLSDEDKLLLLWYGSEDTTRWQNSLVGLDYIHQLLIYT